MKNPNHHGTRPHIPPQEREHIRARWAARPTLKSLAQEYGVCTGTIMRVLYGRPKRANSPTGP